MGIWERHASRLYQGYFLSFKVKHFELRCTDIQYKSLLDQSFFSPCVYVLQMLCVSDRSRILEDAGPLVFKGVYIQES